MPFYFTPYIILPLFSAVVNACLAAFARRRRHVPAALPLFWLMVGMSGWSLAYALNTAATSLTIKILCFKLGTTFVCIIIPSVLALAMESVGRGEWLTRRRLALASLIPFGMLLLSWTNGLHTLVRYDLHLLRSGPLLLLGFKNGPYFLVHLLYTYLVNCLAIVLFAGGFRCSPRSEWPRFALMIAATIIPVLVDLLQIAPVKGFSMTTSTLFISGICYSAAIFRHRLLDLVPVARDTLFEMMSEPVLVLDREGRLATANLAARELFLLPKDSIGIPVSTLLAPYPQLKDLLTGAADACQGCMPCKGCMLDEGVSNRSWHVIRTRIESGGNLHGWIIALRDITTLRQAQEELRYSELRFRTLAENSADSIWQIDRDFHFTYISNADQAMRGFTRKEVVGRSVFDMLNAEGAEMVRRLNRERLEQESRGIRTGSLRCEIQMRRKSGGFIWTEINSNPLRDAGGAIVGYIGAIRDISERKLVEEKLVAEKQKLEDALDRLQATQTKLKELNLTLTQQVEEETEKRLAHERLLARNARLAAMGEMIGAIAHQWRQPLATLGVTIQSIRMAWERQRLDGAFMERAEADAQRQLQYMSDTIEGFRNFFRPTKEIERFIVSGKLHEVVRLVEAQFANSGIRLRVDDDSAEQVEVSGYSNEFKQAVLNLVSNARDAILKRRLMPSRAGMIAGTDDTINLSVSNDGGKIAIEVRDTGSGISPEIADKVFEPYFTTKSDGEGTGIGLYMSRLIIEESMGGSLNFRSGPDGTVFMIELNAE
ncbi:MAG: PAS domain S-box protein [Deltaproteobacteria bacterium]|nr:PAS domain S-box protein [Deltaproteobacteria bacterium]